jgi:hypothetical protein
MLRQEKFLWEKYLKIYNQSLVNYEVRYEVNKNGYHRATFVTDLTVRCSHGADCSEDAFLHHARKFYYDPPITGFTSALKM